MRRRRRRDGFYPAPDFRDREAEDMAGVFDIDLDQPEDAGSEDELEEGVRPGVPGDVARGGVGGEPGRRGDRAGVAAWAREAWCVLGRGDPGGRERSPGIAEAPRGGRGRGRGSRRDGGRAGWADLALGVRPLRGVQVQVSPWSLEQRSPERCVSGPQRRNGARSAPECGRGGASVCCGVGWGGAALAGCPLSAGVRRGRASLWSVRWQVSSSSDAPQPPLFSACRFSPRKRSAVRSDS